MKIMKWLGLCLAAGWLCFPAGAALRLHPLFTDHMVVQHQRPMVVWGWANKGERIKVRFDGKTKTTKTDVNGRWKVVLDAFTAGHYGDLTVMGSKGRLTVRDVRVGEVWLNSGQSNMEMPMQSGWATLQNAAEEIANAHYPEISLFTVEKAMHSQPQDTVVGKWQVCTRENAPAFSAVSYFFARYLWTTLRMPVGIINASWGGTEIQTWIPDEAFATLPEVDKSKYASVDLSDFDGFMKENERRKQRYEAALKEDVGMKEKWFAPSVDTHEWSNMTLPGVWETHLGDLDGVVWFVRHIHLDADAVKGKAVLHLGTIDDADRVWVNGQFVGGTDAYDVDRVYPLPDGLLKEGDNLIVVRVTDYGAGGGFYGSGDALRLDAGTQRLPLTGDWRYCIAVCAEDYGYINVSPNMYHGLLYNAMIHPLVDYPLRGILWYQGESNVGNATAYQRMFPTMISAWRKAWKSDDLPFFWVQLANYMPKDSVPGRSTWAELREAQASALSLPNTGQAVIADIGNADDLHPHNKQDVGKRLALIALRQVYGESLVSSGPVYRSMAVKGNKVEITFDWHGSRPVVRNKYGNIEGFALAGQDRRFYWAKAWLEGDKVVVESDNVSTPVAVRYAWSDNPDINLYNTEGLPAVPFRTDTWKQ